MRYHIFVAPPYFLVDRLPGTFHNFSFRTQIDTKTFHVIAYSLGYEFIKNVSRKSHFNYLISTSCNL